MKKTLLALLAWCFAFSIVQAANYQVTNIDDSGNGSLRKAIEDANNNPGADVITFTLPANSTIIVLSPFLVITDDVTIDGSTATNLTISGGGNSRIFWIQNGTITLQDLTLADGYAKGGNGGGGGMGAGGAIFMHEGKQDPTTPVTAASHINVLSGSIDLRLINVTLKNNTAIGGNGGLGNSGGGGMGGSSTLLGGGGVLGNGAAAGGSITNASGSTAGNNGGIAIFGFGGTESGATRDKGGFGGGAYRGLGGFGGGGSGSVDGGGSFGIGGFGGGGGGAGTDNNFLNNGGANGGYGGGGGGLQFRCDPCVNGDNGGMDGDPGFGGGKGTTHGGGGMGAGGAIFVASGKLTLQNVAFENNTATGGTGGNNGKGYSGALFIFNKDDNGGNAAPGTTNDPQVIACDVTYTNNTASDAADNNSADVYGNTFGPYTAGIVYVNASASGANNGTSWTDAFTTLQDALLAACTCGSSEIWVATGTYYPDEGIGKTDNDRSSTFQLCNGVALYGGFSGNGTETSLSQRNIATNVTILSGDLDQNNTLDNNNAYHVVTGSGTDLTAVLDGFTVTEGNANGTNPNIFGGGMYNRFGAPTVRNCTFSGNSASGAGGGMLNDNSSPSVLNCIFSANTADSGGGMANTNSLPSVINCTFSGNSAANGGGMFNQASSSLSLTNCTFSGNSATNDGGGMYSRDCSPKVTNCIIWNNEDNSGTGTTDASIFNEPSATPTITHSLIQGSGGSGAGWQMSLGTDGGFNKDVDPLFVTQFNLADALRLQPSSPAINMGNNAADLDGAGAGTTTIADIATDLAGNPRILQSTVDMGAYEQLGCPGGSNVILYVNAAAAPGGDGLSWGTAITDLQDALIVACGCSEVNQVWVAKGTYKPTKTIEVESNQFGTLLIKTFNICPGVEVYGGFPDMGNPVFTQRDPTLHLTTLSGDILDNDAPNLSGVDLATHPTRSDNNRGHLVHFFNAGNDPANPTILDGFTITNARQNLPEGVSGGGILNDGSGIGNVSNPIIRNCIISNNLGGGIANEGRSGESSPVLINCIFSNNFSNTGAGMYNRGSGGISSPILINCQFISNYASLTAGGISNEGGNGVSSPTLTNCLFSGNYADGFAGAMFNAVSNSVDGISSPLITNCTFSGNSAGIDGGTILNFVGIGGTAIARIQNTIIWNNEDNSGIGTPEASIFNENGSAVIFNSLIQNITTNDANGNKDGITDAADPNYPDFVMPLAPGLNIGGDYRLQIISPAIDMGDGPSVPTDAKDVDDDGDTAEPTPDLDLNNRIVGASVDMGAFEFPCAAEAGQITQADFTICEGTDPSTIFTATGAQTDAEYSYGFFLVNGVGNMVAYNTTGDFNLGALTPGTYTVYGISYATFNTPTSVLDYLASKTTLTEIEMDDLDNGGDFCLDLTGDAIDNIYTNITVNGVDGGTIAADQTICSGDNPAAFTSTTPGTGSGTITYRWEVSTTGCESGFTSIDGAESATYDAPAGLTQTTYYRRITISTLNGVACEAISNCVTVTVNQITPGEIGGTQTVCITKDPAAFTSVSSATGSGTITYQWESSTTSCDSGFEPIDGAISATFDAAKGQFKGTTYFRRRAISTLNGVACDAVSNCITLTVLNVDCGQFPWNGN